MTNISILTPVYTPAPGGGASYTKLLAEALENEPSIRHVTIFSERFPGEPDKKISHSGRIDLRRRFPFRAGRDRIDVRSYFDYIVQNIDFAAISDWLPHDTDVLLIHSSFHYKINFLGMGLRRLRAHRPNIRIILDVRDRFMTATLASTQDLYDAIICCSLNVYDHMLQLGERRPLRHIPILYQPPPAPSNQLMTKSIETAGLQGKRYVLSTSGVEHKKGIDQLIACFRELRSRGEKLELVVAGRRRDWNNNHKEAASEGLFRYIGSLPPHQIFNLMSGSEMHINISAIEGLPRSSLEAIASGTRVLLPPNIPEFYQHCGLHVISSSHPTSLANQIQWLLQQQKAPPPYPLERHSIAEVIPQYLKLFLEPLPIKQTQI